MDSARFKKSVTSIFARSTTRMPSIHRFHKDESGGMMIFSLFIFIMMIMAGSLAVDFMRLESERARLQTSIDRAVLAGAALDQTLDQKEVITDYLVKSGVKGYVPDEQIVVVDNGRERSAKVTGIINLDTVLMQFIGINQLAAAAAAKADESTPHVEVSLVLDISGSMGRNGRIEKLREAAEGFVNILIPDVQDDDTSSLKTISIIPYSATVSAGEDMLSFYNVNEATDHPFSNCVEFENSAFTTTALSTTLLLEQYPHYDNRDSNRYETHENADYAANGEEQIERPRCRRLSEVNAATNVEDNSILAFQTQSGNTSPLVQHIRNLTADGSTSIDIGLKWGLALLDPSSRDVNANLRGEGIVETLAANRPLDFDRTEATTRKILVLMTDGMMNWVVPPREEFRNRSSNVFYDGTESRSSLLLRGEIRQRTGAVAPMTRVATGNQNDALPGNRWYWIDEERYMDWPDSPAARAPWPYIPESQHFDEDAMQAVIDSLPRTDFTDIRTMDQQENDKELWAKRADWTYLLGDDLVDPVVPAALNQLTHPELFDLFTLPDLRRQVLQPVRGAGWFSGAEWGIYETLWADAKDNTNASTRMIRLCNIAKGYTPDGLEKDDTNERSVTIYSVAMNLSDDEAAVKLMRDCATPGEEYFKNTTTDKIVAAFAEIALDISELRLTQ